MEFQFAGYSNIGMRSGNEDSYAVKPYGAILLAMVADGLGGHANGEVASSLAVNTVIGLLSGKPVDEDALLEALLRANSQICQAGIHGHTTAAAVWMDQETALAAHVGDSRIYHFRDGRILFQSEDHSYVQVAVLVGELEPSAVRHHPDRNRIFRVLGDPAEAPRIDSRELDLRPGDRLLICSDGFWEPVTEEDMLRTLAETGSAEEWLAAMKLLIEITQDPEQDNYTAVCISVL